MNGPLGSLNEAGLERFQAYLDGLRTGHALAPPIDILQSPTFSDLVEPRIDLEESVFASRFAMGQYLVERMQPLDQQRIANSSGLWSWLALSMFDQLCPADSGGSRKPRENYTYILSRNFRHHPRHAIRTTYLFVAKYGETVRFMFSKAMHERGEIVEQLVARQELASCPAVVESAARLYDDPDRRTFKTGAAGTGKGAIRRFVRVLQQFQLTYDLYSLTGDQLIALLPREFDRFRSVS